MKTILRLLLLALTFEAAPLLAQPAPPTLPPRAGPKFGYSAKPNDPEAGTEFREFRFAGQQYAAVLSHRDILSGPEWNPTLGLPSSVNQAEQNARSELQALGTNADDWELSAIQLNKLSQGTKTRWYYALTFTPVLTTSGLPAESAIVLTTLDGRTGRLALLSRQQKSAN